MLTNYIKITLRNLIRNKLYSTISIIGLSIGIACCLLIFLFVRDELSYDSFHAKADDIYRVIKLDGIDEKIEAGSTSTSFPTGPELKKTFPQIINFTRYVTQDFTIRVGDESILIDFDLFPIKIKIRH